MAQDYSMLAFVSLFSKIDCERDRGVSDLSSGQEHRDERDAYISPPPLELVHTAGGPGPPAFVTSRVAQVASRPQDARAAFMALWRLRNGRFARGLEYVLGRVLEHWIEEYGGRQSSYRNVERNEST